MLLYIIDSNVDRDGGQSISGCPNPSNNIKFVCIGPTENRDVTHSTQESPPLGNAS